MTTTIATADIRFVKELYPRLKPHDDVVERYRDALGNLPPIVVARDGVLVDGYHRWQAHVREGVRPGPDPYICLIDAKTESAGNQASPNYSIEVNAVDAGLVFANFLRIPVLYVWSDGGVMTPNTVLNRWSSKQDGSGTNGSKTAFYLVRKAFARKAADVFPTIPRAG